MRKLKPSIKSLILSILVVLINFGAYLSFRLFGFQEFNIGETLLFTAYISVIDFIVIYLVSYALFKLLD